MQTTENTMAADAILEAFGLDEEGNDIAAQVNVSEVNPNPDHDRMPDPFEAPIQGFAFTRAQMEDYIRKHLESAMKEMGLNLRDMALRGGDGTEPNAPVREGRYLETVFEYDDLGRGIYEDEVLKYLDKFHPLALEGVRVVFRPLNDKQTGSLDDYWKNFSTKLEERDKDRKEQAARQAQMDLLHGDDVPEPPPPRTEDPNDTRDRDYQAKIDVEIFQDYNDAEEAKRQRRVGVPFSRDEVSQIAAALGTTTDLRKGGWILPDGRLVNFIKDGVRRKEQDIGIGFTEERKKRISNEVKQRLENLKPHEHKQEGTGPYDINGYAQSQPVDPYGSLAEKTYPEAFPLEAIRGGLIRYALSSDGDVIEIDAYNMPTQGQMDVLEDIHEWVKFVNEGGYDNNGEKEQPTVESDAEITTYSQTEPQEAQSATQNGIPKPPAPPTGQDAMVDEDAFEASRRERQENADREMDAENRRFNGENPSPEKEDIPSSRLIVVFVGSGDEDWWDYDSVEDVQRNLVKDLRLYWRDGKKPNEDFNLPDEVEEDIVVVAVAVDNDCGALGICGIGGGNVAGVELEIAFAGDRRVFQDALSLEAVVPLGAAGKEGIGLVACPFDIIDSVRSGKKGVVAHILADKAAVQAAQSDEDGRSKIDKTFQCHKYNWLF